jgi:hypothetical protein
VCGDKVVINTSSRDTVDNRVSTLLSLKNMRGIQKGIEETLRPILARTEDSQSAGQPLDRRSYKSLSPEDISIPLPENSMELHHLLYSTSPRQEVILQKNWVT